MKTSKTITYAVLGVLAIGLVSCNQTNTKDVVSTKAMNSLAYQATTSLAVMSDLGNMQMAYNVSSPRMLMKKADKAISDDIKTKIESLLPTVDLLMKNDNSFKTEVLTSDRADYNHKQVISFFDINGEDMSYTLYYNLGDEEIAPEVQDSISQEESSIPEETTSETKVDANKDARRYNKKDDEEDDEEENEKETAITFEGIAVVDEAEFSFSAYSTEEVDDEETEKEFELKIHSGEDSYIEVVHEVETEDLEVEEEYRYTIVENGEVVHEFEFEQEKETEDEKEENKVKLVINNEKFSFKFYEEEGIEYIRVKYDNKQEDEGKIIYKKVIETLEDGSQDVHFEEVLK